jgi:valyl-tRNA synthetase
VQLRGVGSVAQLAGQNFDILEKLARVSVVMPVEEHLTGGNARSTVQFEVAVEYERTIDVAAERERLTKEIAKLEKGLASAEKQLGNEAFLAKAPAQVVEGLKKQEYETRLLLERAREALGSLPPE